MVGSDLPVALPHVVSNAIVEVARKHGYSIRELSLAYYNGMDEVLTTIKQSYEMWSRKAHFYNGE